MSSSLVYQSASLGGNVISLSLLQSSSKVHSTGQQPQLQKQSITHSFSIHQSHLEFLIGLQELPCRVVSIYVTITPVAIYMTVIGSVYIQ